MSNLIKILTMEITVNAIHFDPTEKLQDFIQQKVSKLEKRVAEFNTVN